MGNHELPGGQDGLAPGRPVRASIAYREWGDPAAPALLFWPGLQLPAPVMLNEHGPMLATATGRRVIAISPPGWETPELEPVEYLPSALVRRLLGLFDELNLEPLSFVGFSWGATIGCHLAAHAPERLDALVLLDAGYTDFQDRPGYEELDLEGVTASSREQAREARWTTWEECFAFFRPFVRKWRPAVEERLRGAMREENGVIVPIVRPEVFAAAAYGVMAEPPSKTLEELGRLVLPILLAVASDTIGTNHGWKALERFRRAVPRARVEEVDSGHDLLSDAPEETISIIGRFLAGMAPRAIPEV